VDFTIRYYPALTAKMRISHGGDIYDIEGIAEVGGRRRFMKVVTKLQDSNPI
jgi:SPP1 family predicted phage head-tail adaptor